MGKPSRRKQRRMAGKLLQIRKMLKLSQTQIVERMGLTEELPRGSISNFENDRRVPSLFILLRYARLAGLCLEVIVDDELELPRVLETRLVHDPRSRATKPRASKS